jgi:hypothetical protein
LEFQGRQGFPDGELKEVEFQDELYDEEWIVGFSSWSLEFEEGR